MTVDQCLQQTKEVIEKAITDYQPYAIVGMVSGGNDSMALMYALQALDIKPDYVLHVNTRTGIPQTTEFVRYAVAEMGLRYLEGDAGDRYENYLERNGFFGKGRRSHTVAYHILKAEVLRKTISHNIRHRKRGRRVLLLTGARADESNNRLNQLTEIEPDKGNPANVWVGSIRHWPKATRDEFLMNCPLRNPVAQTLCRSGECMCGTMQDEGDRSEASYFYPAWGAWLDALETRIREKHGWGWGEAVTAKHIRRRNEKRLEDEMQMCQSCVLKAPLEEGEDA